MGTNTAISRLSGSAIAAIAAAGLTLSACETYDAQSPDTQRAIGAAIGAAGGYLACRTMNANNTNCALMVLAGAAAGYVIVGRIDSRDEASRNNTIADVLEGDQQAGKKRVYTNPETGGSGSVTVQSVSSNGQCKTLEETYTPAGGDAVSETYTMCKGSDGRWANS